MDTTNNTVPTIGPTPMRDSPSSCIPPKIFERNEFGLICDGSVNYVYEESGLINWKKMIKPEFLVPHKTLLEKIGKQVPETIEKLSDKELLILLGGLKDLAAIRGFSTCTYDVTAPCPEYVVAVCQIQWLPNYETEGRKVIFSSIGDASLNNTKGFGQMYLGAIAENRAFVRCVRNFLRINIVSQEEICEMANHASRDTSTNLLEETATKFGVTFDAIKKELIAEKVAGAEGFSTFNDIPKEMQFALVGWIKREADAKIAEATV